MKRILFIFLLLSSYCSFAQKPSANAGNKTIYVFCGNDLPKKFTYVIERRDEKHPDWQVVAQTSFPNSEAAIKGQLMDMPATILSIAGIPDNVISSVWTLSKRAPTLDSMHVASPYLASALGCAWWDKSVSDAGVYEYRVSKKAGNNVQLLGQTDRTVYPATVNTAVLVPVKMKPGENGATITYTIPYNTSIARIKMYRSKYLENNYEEIVPKAFFTTKNKVPTVEVSDESGLKNVPYSYYIVPVDFFGNVGSRSVAINLYNSPHQSVTSAVRYFTANGDVVKNGNILKWKLENADDLISVDIYRSTGYDKTFTRIGSVSPKDSSFTDYDIQPATTYYYSITGNGNYGRSYPSGRVSAILKGNKPNLYAPTDLSISQTGNIVKLNWRKTNADDRGYYVFRADGYTGNLKPYSRLIMSKDNLITWYDTVSVNKPAVFSYTVASVNTSYAISPASRRVNAVIGGAQSLPIPTDVNAIAADGRVNVFWKDLSRTIAGYKIYRTAINESDVKVEDHKQMGGLLRVNSFKDTTVNSGWHYVYYVKSVGEDTTKQSSESLAASCTLPRVQLAAPGNVLAMNSDQNVLVKWDSPVDPSVKAIRVYRAEVNGTPKAVNDVKLPGNSFLDTGVKPGATYFYLLSSVDANGKESPLTGSVGIHKE